MTRLMTSTALIAVAVAAVALTGCTSRTQEAAAGDVTGFSAHATIGARRVGLSLQHHAERIHSPTHIWSYAQGTGFLSAYGPSASPPAAIPVTANRKNC